MKSKFTLLLAAGLFFAVVSQAQTHNLADMRHNKKEMFIDKRNIHREGTIRKSQRIAPRSSWFEKRSPRSET